LHLLTQCGEHAPLLRARFAGQADGFL
jgi:hypothetical protein